MRRLSLTSEPLTELTADELTDVAAGYATDPCPSFGPTCSCYLDQLTTRLTIIEPITQRTCLS